MRNYLIFSLFVLLTSCKSYTLFKGETINGLSTSEIINKNKSTNNINKTIKARLKIYFTSSTEEGDATAKLRMEKDSIIWLSITKTNIPFLKVHITKDTVKLYNKIDNTYFVGDYALIEKWLGVPLKYSHLENLLLGEALQEIQSDTSTPSSFKKDTYFIENKDAISILFGIYADSFKIKETQLWKDSKAKSIRIQYDTYQEIESVVFPKQFSLETIGNDKEIHLSLEYKALELDKKLKFPFKIPEGYTKITP